MIQFFNSLDQTLKKVRNRGLTKREANLFISSGLLEIRDGKVAVNGRALQAMMGAQKAVPQPSPRVEKPPTLTHAPPRDPLPQPRSGMSTLKSTATPSRPTIPVQTPQKVAPPSPGASHRLRAENKALRGALEQEKAARKAAEFRNESASGLFTSDKRNEALVERVKTLDERNKQAALQIQELENRTRQQEDTIRDLEARCLDNKSTRRYKEEKKKLQEDSRALQEQLRQQQTLVDTLRSQVEESNEHLLQVQQERDAMVAKNNQAQESFRHKVTQLENYSHQQISELKKRLEEEELQRMDVEHRLAQKSSMDTGRASPLRSGAASPPGAVVALEEQTHALTTQLEEAEAARQEIATQNIQLQLQFADAIEDYESRLMNTRRQISSIPIITQAVQDVVDAIQSVLQPLHARSQPLDRKKDAKLLAEVDRLTKSLTPATTRLSDCIQAIRAPDPTTEARSQSFLETLQEYRHQLHAVMAPHASTGSGEMHQRWEREVRARQKLEEANQQLSFELNTRQVVDDDVQALRSSLEEEKAHWQAEMEKTESRHQRHIQTLQAQLTEAAQHRANLESTKNALESTIEMMTMQSADRMPSGDTDSGEHAQSIEEAIQEERRRARQENDRLQQRLDEMRNQLEAAERRASSAVTGDTWAEEMNSVRGAMEKALQRAHQENAALSAQLDAAQAKLQSMEFLDEEDEFDMPVPPSMPPPPPPDEDESSPGLLPPPPPPPPSMPSMGMGAATGSAGRSDMLAAIRGVDRSALRKPEEVPVAATSDDRMDLMAAIRSGSTHLRPVTQRAKEPEGEKFDDPQNMLHALAKVLMLRREGIEDELTEDEDDESWDA